MLDAVLGGVIKNHIIIQQIEHDIGETLRLDFHIGTDTAAVAHLTSRCRVKYSSQAVGDACHRTVGIAFGIIDGLNTTSAGNVIFGSCYLHATIIREFTRHLHQAFSIGAVTHNHSAVEVLQRTGNDFGSRCRSAIHQHGQRNFHIYRLIGCLISTAGLLYFTFGHYYFFSFRHKEVHHIHSFAQ